MIFISGVHGVGKSYFCNLVKEATGIACFSASSLISERKEHDFPADKRVTDIDENQTHLLAAVDELRTDHGEFLLDGHFCLLNKTGEITRVPIETFTSLKPDAIILLTEKPEIIAERRKERDGVEHTVSEDLEDQLAAEDILPRRKEGKNGARWIVLDYAHVIVHLFHPEERQYYNIERLWQDGSNQLPFSPIEKE